jgi:hypothetical protein
VVTVPLRPEALAPLLEAVAHVARELRLIVSALRRRVRPVWPPMPYETLWLELVLDLDDPRGERAVLTRRQGVRFLSQGGAVVRELVWGEGEQLVRYHARGARRLAVRPEGSKRAVLLDPDRRPAVGDRLTIESRRTIRGGFRGRSEYCEAYLERPTGRVDLTIIFPAAHPPTRAQLVRATTETVLRLVPVRYRADGRAVLRCRLRHPDPATTYSLRWSW